MVSPNLCFGLDRCNVWTLGSILRPILDGRLATRLGYTLLHLENPRGNRFGDYLLRVWPTILQFSLSHYWKLALNRRTGCVFGRSNFAPLAMDCWNADNCSHSQERDA